MEELYTVRNKLDTPDGTLMAKIDNYADIGLNVNVNDHCITVTWGDFIGGKFVSKNYEIYDLSPRWVVKSSSYSFMRGVLKIFVEYDLGKYATHRVNY